MQHIGMACGKGTGAEVLCIPPGQGRGEGGDGSFLLGPGPELEGGLEGGEESWQAWDRKRLGLVFLGRPDLGDWT